MHYQFKRNKAAFVERPKFLAILNVGRRRAHSRIHDGAEPHNSGTGTIGLEFLGIANFPGGFANGNTFGVPDEADSALHAIQGDINGASTLAAVDGTTGTPTNGGTAGTQREPHIRLPMLSTTIYKATSPRAAFGLPHLVQARSLRWTEPARLLGLSIAVDTIRLRATDRSGSTSTNTRIVFIKTLFIVPADNGSSTGAGTNGSMTTAATARHET